MICSIEETWLHGRSLRYQHGRFGTQVALRSAWSPPFLVSVLPDGRVLDATGFFAALLHHAHDSIIVICRTGPARWRYCPRRKRPRGTKVISRSSNGSDSGKTKENSCWRGWTNRSRSWTECLQNWRRYCMTRRLRVRHIKAEIERHFSIFGFKVIAGSFVDAIPACS